MKRYKPWFLRRWRCACCTRWFGPLRRDNCPWKRKNFQMAGMKHLRCDWWWNPDRAERNRIRMRTARR